MASRNLTSVFREQRRVGALSVFDLHDAISSPAARAPRDAAPFAGARGAASAPAASATAEAGVPPRWMDVMESVRQDIARIRSLLPQLVEAHDDHLKVRFDDAGSSDTGSASDELSEQIASLMRRAESNLKRIASVDSDSAAFLLGSERTVRLNAIVTLGSELREISRLVRDEQLRFRALLQEKKAASFDATSSADPDLDADLFFSSPQDSKQRLLRLQAQQQLHEQHELAMARQREEEILRVARTVEELSRMFRELNELVVAQGTVLDRIDFNVEHALQDMTAANDQLHQANRHSSSSGTMCIAGLALTAALLAGVLGYKLRH